MVEALKHCVHDWSADGADEHDHIFAPILEVLYQVPVGKRIKTKALVPGAGLGRLAWEIVRMDKFFLLVIALSLLQKYLFLFGGFDVTANEVTSCMNIQLKMLLNDAATPTQNVHTICPHYSWFSHTRPNTTLFQLSSFQTFFSLLGVDDQS